VKVFVCPFARESSFQCPNPLDERAIVFTVCVFIGRLFSVYVITVDVFTACVYVHLLYV